MGSGHSSFWQAFSEWVAKKQPPNRFSANIEYQPGQCADTNIAKGEELTE